LGAIEVQPDAKTINKLASKAGTIRFIHTLSGGEIYMAATRSGCARAIPPLRDNDIRNNYILNNTIISPMQHGLPYVFVLEPILLKHMAFMAGCAGVAWCGGSVRGTGKQCKLGLLRIYCL
jgi:hypothetical protein